MFSSTSVVSTLEFFPLFPKTLLSICTSISWPCFMDVKTLPRDKISQITCLYKLVTQLGKLLELQVLMNNLCDSG